MEITAACVALETIDKGHVVIVYSDSSYLVNCMRRGWYKQWRKSGWLTYRKEPVANRDLWERLLERDSWRDSWKRRCATRKCDGGR
jgi:ribonuclease HI